MSWRMGKSGGVEGMKLVEKARHHLFITLLESWEIYKKGRGEEVYRKIVSIPSIQTEA